MGKLITPQIGTTCPALIDENYEYHLSGDATKFCKCAVTEKACVGRVISDPEDRSSQFFSRGKCMINQSELLNCALYGASKEVIVETIKHRHNLKLEEKLKQLGDGK